MGLSSVLFITHFDLLLIARISLIQKYGCDFFYVHKRTNKNRFEDKTQTP